MSWGTISTLIEGLWWSLAVAALLVLGCGWLWSHRPWRDKRTFGEHYAELTAEKWREIQARELDALEAEVQAEGCDIWRPDPRRVREVSASE